MLLNNEKNDKGYKTLQFAVWVIIFIIIHGEMIFNKLSWHDDIYFIDKLNTDLDYGRVYGTSHGRFSFFFLIKAVEKITSEGIIASPVEQGIVSAVCTICIGYLIIRILNIKESVGRVSVILICISIPATAGNLGYMTFAGYDLAGALLAVVAAYYCICHENKKSLILSSFLLALAIGEYQCYLTLFLAILMCHFIGYLIIEERSDRLLKVFIRYAVTTLLSVVLYLIINRAVLSYFHENLTDYGSINTYGIVPVAEYFKRIVLAYKDFINPEYTMYTMFPMRYFWHAILLGLLLLEMIVIGVYIVSKKKVVSIVFWVLLAVVIPMVFNFNIVMYGTRPLHSLHQYQYILLYALIIMLGELICKPVIRAIYPVKNIHFGRVYLLVAGYVFFMGFLYVRYDNLCYTEAELRQSQAISYFNALISDIHNADGYYNEIPVCYVNEFDKRLPSNHDNYEGKNLIVTNPYNSEIMGNIAMTHSWREYMAQWCNYAPYSTPVISQLSEAAQLKVESMPRYPDKGSIKVIEGTLVINF